MTKQELDEDYVARKEQELREHDARVAMNEARAREGEATEQLQELSGLKALRAQVHDHLRRFKEAAPADREQSRSAVETGWKAFVARLHEIGAKLDGIDDVREKRMNAQLDQLDAEIVEFNAKIEQKVIELDIHEQAALKRVQDEQAKALEQRRELSVASSESRQELKSAFSDAVAHLKESWSHVRDRVESAHRSESHPPSTH